MTNRSESADVRTVSVIIPTTCEARRADLLLRAVESVVAQRGAAIELLVVVNGHSYDEMLFQKLKADSRLQVIYLEQANYSAARYMGVRHVTSQYFCFLDDDDELLPDASQTRLDVFADEGEGVDVVITNGVEHSSGKDSLLLPPDAAEKILSNPGTSFLEQNWFASCGPLFKTASIEPELFNFTIKYFEWTYLFFLLLSKGKRLRYHDEVTYRINKDNPFSVSKSIAYEKASAEFLPHLLGLPLDADLHERIRDKYVVALNTLSTLELAEGRPWRAWSSHIKCLQNGGWRFFPFTRRLVFHSLFGTS